MGYFPRTPRPPRKPSKALPRQPKDWRRRTHVCVSAGTKDWDGMPICVECDHRADHKIHDLNESVQLEAGELERRKLGEANDGG